MCNPLTGACTAVDYPLLIDTAMDRVHRSKGEVHLSKSARDVLYTHGNAHKLEFERALKDKDTKKFEDLSKSLQKRLEKALVNSKQTDPSGRPYNPPRIDGDAMKKVLDADPWTP